MLLFLFYVFMCETIFMYAYDVCIQMCVRAHGALELELEALGLLTWVLELNSGP